MQGLTSRKNKVITFKYCSEVTFKMGKEKSWFTKMYSEGEQFIANYLLRWFKPFILLANCFTTDFEFYSVVPSYPANA